MILGIVSDTHGHTSFTRAAVCMFQAFEVDLILHCGDIGGPEIMHLFHPWKTHWVYGNVDQQIADLREASTELGHEFHEAYAELSIAEKKIALLHGDNTPLLQETIESEKFDLVCHGHTHQQKIEKVGKTLVVNPGAIYRAQPHSIGIIELPQLEAKIIPLVQ